jgi:general secretion pathway protein K
VRFRNRRGVALILVLSLLIVLGLIAAEVASRARAEGRMIIAVQARAEARYAAESGILMARSSIAAMDTAFDLASRAKAFRHLDTLEQSFHHIAIGPAQFDVAIVDLNGRIDLNRASETTLRRFFNEFAPGERAATIAAALKAQPISRFGELARVPGADDALALAVAPYVTVWSDGIIDVNAASVPVLGALPGIGPAVAQTIVRRRDGGETFSTADQFRPQTSAPVTLEGFPAMTVAPTRILIVSRGWVTGSPASHEIQAVYMLVGRTMTLQNWEERDR